MMAAVMVGMPRHARPLPPIPNQTRPPIPSSGALAVEPPACLSLPIGVPRVDRTASQSSPFAQTPVRSTPTANSGSGRPVSSNRSARLDTPPLQRWCCGWGGVGGGDYRSRVCNGVGVAALVVVTTVPAATPVRNVATAVAPAVRQQQGNKAVATTTTAAAVPYYVNDCCCSIPSHYYYHVLNHKGPQDCPNLSPFLRD
ncbi:hypothetical protein BGX38DRAFT_1222086 [Terfezia claveryi]|nr:hypothetical protein BGX38DRAFT_1222086 [Terfezia claveryi]